MLAVYVPAARPLDVTFAVIVPGAAPDVGVTVSQEPFSATV